jgi:hypothetical protein
VIKRTLRAAARLSGGCVALALVAAAPAQAAESPSGELPPSYAAVGSGISYFDTPNRHHTTISGTTPATLGKVSVTLGKASDVLVQFSSGLATTTDQGCPCSVRASLQVDDRPGVVVKRVNLALRPPIAGDNYIPDRQSLDGSFVFPLPPGRHDVALVVQQIDGSTETIQAFYVNIQALTFPKR